MVHDFREKSTSLRMWNFYQHLILSIKIQILNYFGQKRGFHYTNEEITHKYCKLRKRLQIKWTSAKHTHTTASIFYFNAQLLVLSLAIILARDWSLTIWLVYIDFLSALYKFKINSLNFYKIILYKGAAVA